MANYYYYYRIIIGKPKPDNFKIPSPTGGRDNNREDETTQKQNPIPLMGEWDNNKLRHIAVTPLYICICQKFASAPLYLGIFH